MPAAGAWFAKIGVSLAASFGATLVSTTVATWVGIVAFGYTTYSALRSSRLKDPGEADGPQAPQILVRSTLEPRKIVYGEAVVSGPIWYMNSLGQDNRSLYIAIALTGHEIDSFRGYYLDDKFIPIADVDDVTTGGDGSVDADTNSHGFGPIATGLPVLLLREHLGTAAQTVDSILDSGFAEITSNHRLRGCAWLLVVMHKLDGAEEVWQSGSPGNISALIRGKKVYDPRLDSTFSGTWGTGSGAHRLATPSTWAYSTCPPLCLADYLIDADLGAGFDSARIDYNAVAIAADVCDANVAIPVSTTQDRFTCNGVLMCSDNHRENIEKILSSMAGSLRYYGGQWRIRAGAYLTADFALNESYLVGPIKYKKQPEASERYNGVRGSFIDPLRRYKESQYLTVDDATTRANRDDGIALYKELDLPMTGSEYMAQRLAFRALEQCTQTGLLTFPTGYNGLNIAPGDTGTVTLPELGFSSKVFRCIGLQHVDMVGVELVLKEDDSAAYADPVEGDYGTRTAAGVINFPGVPLPTVGVVVDPMFTLEIGEAWIVSAGSGVSILVGGGEGGGNALQLTNAASVTQAAYNGRMFDTAPGEVIGGQMRVQKTADVTSVIVRTTYYRRDTLASLGTVDQNVTARIATNGAYYTVAWRQHTPTTYTLANDLRMKARIEIRMVPDGSGTATATVSSFNADRMGIVGTDEIDVDAATTTYFVSDTSEVQSSSTTETKTTDVVTMSVSAPDANSSIELVVTYELELTGIGIFEALAGRTTSPTAFSLVINRDTTDGIEKRTHALTVSFDAVAGSQTVGIRSIIYNSLGDPMTATYTNVNVLATVVKR